MSDVFAQFWPALRCVIRQAWPEIQGDTHPIYRATQAMRRPWRELLEKGQVQSPWVVVSVANPSQVPGWGSLNVVYQPTVTVAYCTLSQTPALVGGDVAEYIEAKLAALQDLLTNHQFIGSPCLVEKDLPGFQCLGDFRLDVTEDNPANQVFINQNVPAFGGTLTFSVLLGFISETPEPE